MKNLFRVTCLTICFIFGVHISWCQSITSIITSGSNRILICKSGSGILRSDDGGIHWQFVIKNMWDQTEAYLLTADRYGNIFAATGYSNIYYSTNYGDTWVQSTDGLPPNGGACCLSSDNGGRLFFGNNLGLFRQTSLGGIWTKISSSLLYNPSVNSLTVTDSGKIFMSSIALGPSGNVPITYVSTDHGNNWAKVDSGRLYYGMIHIGEDTVFAGGYQNGLYRSTNGGDSWSLIGIPSAYIVSFTVDKRYVYVGSNADQGIYRMLRSGDSLQYLATSPSYVHSLATLPNATILAGTSTGIFSSTDCGQTWPALLSQLFLVYPTDGLTEITTNPKLSWNLYPGATSYRVQISTESTFSRPTLDTSNVTDTFVHITGLSGLTTYFWHVNANTLSGSSDWSTTWHFTTGATTSIHNKTNIPSVISLFQNYPNPFNPSTTISFALPSRSFVTLKVFDLLGREVSTIVSEEMSAGSYSRTWSTTNVSSGIYFYRLQAGSFIDTKKCYLLR